MQSQAPLEKSWDDRNVIAAQYKLCVAPMMDWTDKHCRFVHRILSPHARLYTEMVTAPAIKYGDAQRLLAYNAQEHPVALQLGGSDPEMLQAAAKLGHEFGYDEINLNCGCPSDRVQAGKFGACLMAEPNLVADCVSAMRAGVEDKIPVTIKCRIGIDDVDPEPFLMNFIETVAKSGCDVFIVHARKAWLKGLSPKENRDIPPLDYELVERVKTAFPELVFVLNGGLTTLPQVQENLGVFDGVMLGRAAYQTPDILPLLEYELFGTPPKPDSDVIESIATYMDSVGLTRPIARHITGLFAGKRGARAWRQGLAGLVETNDGSSLRGLWSNLEIT